MSFSLHALWLWALQQALMWLDQEDHFLTALEVDCNAHLLHSNAPEVSEGRLEYNRAFSFMPNRGF